MELRRYWQVITRYWAVIIVLTLVGVFAAYQYYTSNRPTYQAVSVINLTDVASPNDVYSGLYSHQASEYTTDDFTQIIKGNRFLEEVAAALKEGGNNLSADEIAGLLTIERKHRVLSVTVDHPVRATALIVAQVIATTLEKQAANFEKPRQIVATIIDYPNDAKPSGGRQILLAVVRVLAGLIAGIGLSFLLAYLDNSVKTKTEAEEVLGLPVLGVIPTAKQVVNNNGPFFRADTLNVPVKTEAEQSSDKEQVPSH